MARGRRIRFVFRAWALVVALAIAGGGEAFPAPPAAGAGSAVAARPMTTAHRASGVAPLAVFFDAVDDVATTEGAPTFAWASGVRQPSDPEGAQYAWDFGDPSSGSWPTTGRSRNTATGYTAAHVYETPGAYDVTLTVTDTDGAVSRYVQRITVLGFTGQTRYASAGGGGSGTSEASPTSWAKGIAWVNGGSGRRLLLKRGDTFPTTGVVLSAAGPNVLGAYGEGPRPVLEVTGRADGIAIRGADWRVVDLEVRSPTARREDRSGLAFVAGRQTVDALVLRVKTTNFRVGILVTGASPGGPPHDGNAFVECEVETPYSNGMYVGGRRLAVLGCDLHDVSASHVLRVWQAHKAVISNNRLWNPGPTRHALKLHGPHHGDGRAETRWATVSDNLVRGKTWSVAIGPEDDVSDTRVSHVVYERNRHHPEESVGIDLLVEGCRDVMVRNNLFDGSNVSRSYRGIRIARRGIEPVPDRIRVLHNTIVRDDEVRRSFRGVEIQTGATNVTVRGNLMAAPLVPREERLAVDDAGAGAGLVVRDNLLVTPEEAGFADLRGGDLSLRPVAGAVDAGAPLPEVRTDFRGVVRPLGRSPDLGALESR